MNKAQNKLTKILRGVGDFSKGVYNAGINIVKEEENLFRGTPKTNAGELGVYIGASAAVAGAITIPIYIAYKFPLVLYSN